jgi:lysophospholipase L1-like esterase
MKTSRLLLVLLLLSFALNLALGYKYIRKRFYTYSPDYTYNRKQLFEVLPIDSNSIVFIGNSLTQQFELAESFRKVSVKNRGINGETTKGLLNRLTPILKSSPAKVFIEIGVNDLNQGVPQEDIINNYTQIISRIQRECPAAQVFVETVFPVKKTGKLIENSVINNENIRTINQKLKELSSQKKCNFIDTYSSFELNGEMNPKLCLEDGLHLSGEGYLLWTKILKPYIAD